MSPLLKAKVASGVLWNALQLLINRGFGFIIKLVLARLLFPEEFGLVGMAAVFTELLVTINELGMGAALIQRKADQLTESHYNTAFWSAIGFSTLLFLIIAFGLGPLAAMFYEEPVLATIMPVMGSSVLIRPLNLIHQVKLTRKLDFKTQAIITNSSNIIAGIIAIGLAYSGWGVWSIIANGLLGGFFAVPFMWRAVKWTPRFEFSKKCFKDIFGFGVFNTGTNVINYIFSNIDYLIIGKMLGPAILGVYTLAFTLTDTFRSQLMSVFNQVMFPVYGMHQNNEALLKSSYLKVVKLNSLAIFPIMVLFIVLGQEIVLYFFGEKWRDAILPLQILSLSVIFHMMVSSNNALIRGMGYPKLEMKIQLVKALLIYCPLIITGVYYYGIIGASIAILINKIISVLIAQYYLRKLVGISVRDSWNNLKECFLATVTAGAVGYFFKSYVTGQVYLATVVTLLCYCGIAYVTLGKEIILEFKNLKRGTER